MDWLLALLAFAGIMAVLSTVVTGTVEALHKVFSLRKSGLQEMLRALHDAVLVDVDGEAARPPAIGGGSKEAAEFARQMTKSPAYGGRGRWWWPSNWGLNISQRYFERLTPRQFAEQLGQTEIGRSIATQNPAEVRGALRRAVYEFDRYGVAQSQYFRRRAKVLSGLVAFAFVLFANFNAISLYMHLAQDPESRNNIIAQLDGGDPAAVAVLSAQLQGELSAALRPDESGDAPDRALVERRVENILVARDRLMTRAAVENGLPVGMRYFPFCEREGLDGGDAFSLDPERCTQGNGQIGLVGNTNLAVWAPVERLYENPANAAAWLMSMVASAGLLALGSPFWYQVFGRISQMAGGAAKAAAQEVTNTQRRDDGQSRAGRRSEDPDLDELTEAFLLSADPSAAPLVASASGKRGASPASPDDPPPYNPPSADNAPSVSKSLRGVHGDWTGS